MPGSDFHVREEEKFPSHLNCVIFGGRGGLSSQPLTPISHSWPQVALWDPERAGPAPGSECSVQASPKEMLEGEPGAHGAPC